MCAATTGVRVLQNMREESGRGIVLLSGRTRAEGEETRPLFSLRNPFSFVSERAAHTGD